MSGNEPLNPEEISLIAFNAANTGPFAEFLKSRTPDDRPRWRKSVAETLIGELGVDVTAFKDEGQFESLMRRYNDHAGTGGAGGDGVSKNGLLMATLHQEDIGEGNVPSIIAVRALVKG